MTRSSPSREASDDVGSLKRRIAELETQLAEESAQMLEHPLAALALGVASATGPKFFDVLVTELARVLACDGAFVGILTGDDNRSVQTLAYCRGGQRQENFSYELANTPCENVVNTEFCCYDGNVQELFPLDAMLREGNVKSYAGMPIHDSAGKAIGLLSVMSCRSLGNQAVVEAMLRITATRASAEIERAKLEQQRLATEEQLRRQLAELSALYSSVPIGLALLDADLRFVSINDKLARSSAQTPESHRGKTVREVIPLIADEVEKRLEEVRDTGQAVVENEVTGPIYPGGNPDTIRRRTYIPVKDEFGHLVGVSILVEDITKQKQTERQLRKSEEELRRSYAELSTIYRTAPIGLAFVDTQLRYRAISEVLAKINGKPVSDHYGRTLGELLPELGNSEMPLMQRVLDTGEPVIDQQIDVELPSHPGEMRHYRRSLLPVRADDGRLLGLNIVVQDVTVEYRALAALRIRDHAMRSAIGGIVLSDMQGITTWVNPAMEAMLGYTSEEMVGTDGGQIIANPENIPEILRSLHENGGWSGEFKARRKDGTPFDLFVQASVVRDANGQPISTMSWCEDITAKKKQEAEREKLIEQLEAKNAELERFTYTVSHDLKSPLVTISGFVGMLEHDLKSGNMDAAHEDLAEISTATVRMKRLLDELLQLSRIGRVMNPPEDVSLVNLAEQAVRNLQSAASGARIEIDPKLPIVRGDPVRLLEVVQNLVDNAFRFSQSASEPLVRVGQRRQAGQMVVTVSDNGIGIEPQYLKRIFNLFEQLDPSAGGTGVGLAIAKRIVEVHGGLIWAESEGLGKGTTFCFTLPETRAAQ